MDGVNRHRVDFGVDCVACYGQRAECQVSRTRNRTGARCRNAHQRANELAVCSIDNAGIGDRCTGRRAVTCTTIVLKQHGPTGRQYCGCQNRQIVVISSNAGVVEVQLKRRGGTGVGGIGGDSRCRSRTKTGGGRIAGRCGTASRRNCCQPGVVGQVNGVGGNRIQLIRHGIGLGRVELGRCRLRYDKTRAGVVAGCADRQDRLNDDVIGSTRGNWTRIRSTVAVGVDHRRNAIGTVKLERRTGRESAAGQAHIKAIGTVAVVVHNVVELHRRTLRGAGNTDDIGGRIGIRSEAAGNAVSDRADVIQYHGATLQHVKGDGVGVDWADVGARAVVVVVRVGRGVVDVARRRTRRDVNLEGNGAACARCDLVDTRAYLQRSRDVVVVNHGVRRGALRISRVRVS